VSEKAKFFHANNTVLIFAKMIINRLCRSTPTDLKSLKHNLPMHFTFHEQQHVITKKQSTWAVSSTLMWFCSRCWRFFIISFRTWLITGLLEYFAPETSLRSIRTTAGT